MKNNQGGPNYDINKEEKCNCVRGWLLDNLEVEDLADSENP